jgi:hypothetical protein
MAETSQTYLNHKFPRPQICPSTGHHSKDIINYGIMFITKFIASKLFRPQQTSAGIVRDIRGRRKPSHNHIIPCVEVIN